MRYLVFAFRDYYPSGGLEDLVLMTNDIAEVKECLESGQVKDEYQNYQVLDSLENKVSYTWWGYDNEPLPIEERWFEFESFIKSEGTDYKYYKDYR